MVKWLMKRGIAAFERQWNYDASYVHELIEADPRAAWMFSRAAAIGKYRKDVPPAVWAAAAITAVRHEDCGPCTQLGVSMAERAGVDAKVLRAVLTENPNAMPEEVALAWRFTRATLDHDPAADQYRRGDYPAMGTESGGEPRLRDGCLTDLSHGQIRDGARQGVHARRCRRRADRVRPRC